MSFAHIGYPVVSAASMAPQATSVTARSSPKSPPGSPCCETGRPIATDPMTGQTVCSCQYGPGGAALYNYSRVPGLPEAFYNQAAMAAQAAQLQQLAAAADPSVLYGGMTSPYDFKGLPTAAGLYPYDPALAAYPYAAGFLDPNARRKNATRESTQTLKAWLSEHKKNPYPTKGEKIMLAIITKMTLTQVSTWFANARRRLKKENKMTWEPRNRMDDEDDDGINSDMEDHDKKDDEDENISVDSDNDDEPANNLRNSLITASIAAAQFSSPLARPHYGIPNHHHHMITSDHRRSDSVEGDREVNNKSKDNDNESSLDKSSTNNNTKPKIWSMAEIATSSNNKTDSSENSNSAIIQSSIKEHMSRMPSIISQGLHPAWRGAAHHPYLHPHFAQRLATFPSSHAPHHPLASIVASAAPHSPQHPAAATTAAAAAAAALTAAGGPTRHHFLPAFTSLPQFRPHDSAGSQRVSAFSPPASATSPSSQAQRNV